MPFDISRYLPGFKNNTASAEANIGQQLTGMPSTAPSRAKAAYFGATSGLPNSGVSDALGYDLYGQDAERQKQSGFDNLIKMITSYSGNAFADPSQQFQQDEYQQNFNENRRQSDLARQDAQNSLLASRRSTQPNGIYRMPGRAGGIPGGENLPWWSQR